eukprot:CAMPEP_0168506802 /NCGR_PEP_ID=MMETSP0228-20121227/77560_1 /TAXON_ID=133427 /ORGANISM="Protoceratium reticulatum, Strain CCCM 535 (=CCMP 1889)" /LENGTH=443 /DNA_ID=CAMNT_0008523903 /DNA_START=79 /DNA_END=1406 /DNA_ORIENTATION=+
MTASKRQADAAAGHASRGEGAIFFVNDVDGTPTAVLKQLDEGEFAMYNSLWNNYEDDSVLPFIPRCEGVVEMPAESGDMCKYMQMTNLLQDFRRPKIMDVKIGIRTFLEEECDSRKMRADLYHRMLKTFPSHVTEEDRERQGITKLRWMQLRDSCSTIRNLGFRIDGIAGCRSSKDEMEADLGKLRQGSEARDEFCRFAKVAANDDGREPNGETALSVAELFLEKMQDIQEAFEESSFVRAHECIGSSVLLVADAYGKVGAFWIDFGKTRPLPAGVDITHRSPWAQGNHEDGVFSGLEAMVRVWSDAVELLRRERGVTNWRGVAKRRTFSGHVHICREPVNPRQRLAPASPVDSGEPSKESQADKASHRGRVSFDVVSSQESLQSFHSNPVEAGSPTTPGSTPSDKSPRKVVRRMEEPCRRRPCRMKTSPHMEGVEADSSPSA